MFILSKSIQSFVHCIAREGGNIMSVCSLNTLEKD